MTKDRINGIALEKMTSENPCLTSVIQFSIGFPTDDKIQKIIESYQNDSHDLIGAFLENALIAVLGIKREPQKIVIRHISVLPEWRMQSIGALLVTYVKKLFYTLQITCETDEESVSFYQKWILCATHFRENMEIHVINACLYKKRHSFLSSFESIFHF